MLGKKLVARLWIGCLALSLAVTVRVDSFPLAASEPSPATAQKARRLLDEAGIQGGLVVHLGCGNGELTAALRAGDSYLVHGLDADPANVEAARSRIQALGLYGRVSIDGLQGDRLPYIDNVVNLIVAENPGRISTDEILRVLAPNGVALVKSGSDWTRSVKQRPPEIDEWTHYLHDPSNNAVAHDDQVGPPRHMQWVAAPNWSRHHDHMASMSALVSSGGRIFYIMDEGPRESILLPSQWFVIARDAFNGAILWKRPIPEWNTQLWPLKSGPNQLPRRLVAVGDRVYVTLGIDAPVTALDAASGKTVRTYAGTDHADEILCADGTLYLLVAHSGNKWKQYRPVSTYVWDNTKWANSEYAWDEESRSVMAIGADSGRPAWQKETKVAPLTMGLDENRLYFYDGEKVVALQRADGSQAWASEPVRRTLPFPTGYGPTLVVQQDVVLLSIENKTMTAFSAADGKTLWNAPHHRGGHASPDDMLVIQGLVWSADVANNQNSGMVTGRDLRTGQVKVEFPPDVNPPWFHHRCYRSRGTDNYFIAARTGTEFIDLKSKHWDINHWVRGGCLYGFMPANGLLYEPPQSCGCFLESKLFAFTALAAASPGRQVPRDVPDEGRLQRGPASEQPLVEQPAAADEWPTYRSDAARSGSVKTSVPADLKQAWQVQLGGRLSSVVVAQDKVFLAAIDAHAVHAFDARTGKPAWTFTSGARVDSPPTFFQGRVLFGSTDGWVYCLRAADGQLIWRFRATPEDRRLVAYDQLESAWPVSGAVLVENGSVYCVAGRSSFLDGGMRLLRLDPRTGRKLSETILDEKDPATGENLQGRMEGQDMPVALPDVLSSDGRSIYMRAQAFDLDGARRHIGPVKQTLQQRAARRGQESETAEDLTQVGNHLFSRSGFLDDSWFWRSYWIYGRAINSNYGGWLQPGHMAPCGRLMVFSDNDIFGFDRKPEYLCNASVAEYYVYRADRQVTDEGLERVRAATERINAASPKNSPSSSDWAIRKQFPITDQNPSTFRWAQGDTPIMARGLVLAGDTVFLAGPPDLVNDEEAFKNPDDPAIRARLEAQAAALQGRMGSQLLVLAAADGKKLAAYQLPSMPTFDGMAAAQGRLYLTTVDGTLICLAGEGTPLPAAADAALAPLDISIHPAPPALPAPAPSNAPAKGKPKAKAKTRVAAPAGPSLNDQFAETAGADVTASSLGYRVFAEGGIMGLALQKLPAPLSGKVRLKVRMKLGADAGLKNGFLVFGQSPDPAALVHCGLRAAMNKAFVAQGPVTGSNVQEGQAEIDPAGVQDVEVSVELGSGEVTMTSGKTTVRTTLWKKFETIAYVGYGVIDAVTDFSPVETSAQ
ncbi:MAG: outer membrane protein assembly factor BamB family protein [Thermoguttaceae bacterium]